ncbi:MAG TPA: hypothetical protein VLZ06_05575 [Solirubrobacteraceae bacterium]|nr:hypothetical protein [Solirubrobacteraceae bacterium]
MSPSRRADVIARLRWFVRSVEQGDEPMVEEVLCLSSSRRLFAPLAYLVGAFAMLLEGLRRLLHDWRLVPVEVLPAVWLWLAMYDLRLHVLRGSSFHSAHEGDLVAVSMLIVGVTVAALFLNVVFAFAVAGDRASTVGDSMRAAAGRGRPILLVGLLVGCLLAASVTAGARLSRPWFTVSLGISVGLLMVVYLSLPSRLLGVDARAPRRDRLAASAIGATLSVLVTAPFYAISRVGLLMLGSSVLAVPGYLLLTLGVLLQAGGVGAVRAIRMSSALVDVGRRG